MEPQRKQVSRFPLRALLSPHRQERYYRFLRDHFGLNKKALMLFASAFLGVFVAGVALALKFLIAFFLSWGIDNEDLEQVRFLLPLAGGLLVGLLVWKVHGKKKVQGGVESTIKMLRVDHSSSRLRDVVMRFVTSAITLGSGGSAGKEGPVVHIGGGMGSLLGRYLQFPESFRRTLVGAGAAAGISAAFQAPIAGSFFALEILLADFTLDTFSMIVVASVAATAATQSFGEAVHHIHSPQYIFSSFWELAIFAGMGILGGLVNVIFVRTLETSDTLFARSHIPVWFRPAAGGLLMGILALAFPFVYGEGYAVMNLLLDGDFSGIASEYLQNDSINIALVLLLLILLKIVATALILGSGGSGGTIIPALFIGAGVGAFAAELTSVFMPHLDFSPGTWALAGMSSVLAGMTQAPLFSITLFFELTRSYESMLPVLIVVSFAMLVSRHFLRGSLYGVALRKEGIQLYQGMEQSIMQGFQVSELMHRRINIINSNASLGSIVEGFLHSSFSNGFVTDQKGRFIGTISLEGVREFIPMRHLFQLIIAEEVVEHSDKYLFPGQTLFEALELMDQVDAVYLPVLENAQTLKPIAYITRKEIISVYNREVVKRGTQNVLIEQAGTERSNYLHLGNEFHIETLPVPRRWINKTLKDIDLRAQYNLTVIGIKRSNEVNNIVPDAAYTLGQTDQLTIVGKPEDLSRLIEETSRERDIFHRLITAPFQERKRKGKGKK